MFSPRINNYIYIIFIYIYSNNIIKVILYRSIKIIRNTNLLLLLIKLLYPSHNLQK